VGFVLYRIYWVGWIGGVIVIILSRFGLVTSDVGWAGFYVACAAAVLSRLPRRAAAEQDHEFAVLTRSMLESHDRGLELALDSLRRGGTVLYEGLAFAARPGNEFLLAAGASLPAAELNERQALQEAERAQATFAEIAKLSTEIAALASEKRQRISLISEFGVRGVEICQVTDGLVEWKIER
jgi:hypothetical protein